MQNQTGVALVTAFAIVCCMRVATLGSYPPAASSHFWVLKRLANFTRNDTFQHFAHRYTPSIRSHACPSSLVTMLCDWSFGISDGPFLLPLNLLPSAGHMGRIFSASLRITCASPMFCCRISSLTRHCAGACPPPPLHICLPCRFLLPCASVQGPRCC